MIDEKKLDDLKRIFRVSKSVKMEHIRQVLQLDENTFNKLIFKWAEEFGFEIDREYINIEEGDVDRFIAHVETLEPFEDIENQIITQQVPQSQSQPAIPPRIPNFKAQNFDLDNKDLSKRFHPPKSCINCIYATFTFQPTLRSDIQFNAYTGSAVQYFNNVPNLYAAPIKIICGKYKYVIFNESNPNTHDKRFAICDSYKGFYKIVPNKKAIYINVDCPFCSKTLKVINRWTYFKVVRCPSCKRMLSLAYIFLFLQVAKCIKCGNPLRTKYSKSRVVVYRRCKSCGNKNRYIGIYNN